MTEKTHFRKAFDSPYLSSADIVEPTTLTIRGVRLEGDKTKKTKDVFNTAYFVEKEIRRGEALKPMILNATNSKTLRSLTNSPFIEDWAGTRITVYVDSNVRFGREVTEGLRISPYAPENKPQLSPGTRQWENAKAAYRRDENLDAVKKRVDISEEHERLLVAEVKNEQQPAEEVKNEAEVS